MSALPSARVAARLRSELGIEVDEVPGHHGEFIVLVDGEPIRRGNSLAVRFGLIPPAGEIVAAVRERLSAGAG
jgi:hypothetical protein